uniref:Uncharacterized protein n=1 Tax=Vespula pensylvanica TaxID=30213 RepID=A0A834KT54_VESPE|nr:hypothetical protein H0235_013411 [Vespula pensylvanica]
MGGDGEALGPSGTVAAGGPYTYAATHSAEKPTSAPTNNYPYYPILEDATREEEVQERLAEAALVEASDGSWSRWMDTDRSALYSMASKSSSS